MRNIVLEQKESKYILAVVLSVCTKATKRISKFINWLITT